MRDPAETPALSLSDLQNPGTRIAVLAASELYSVAKEKFPAAEILQYDTFADVFNAVDRGKADAALGYPNLANDMKESYPNITHLPDVIEEFDYGFAMQKNEKGNRLKEKTDVEFLFEYQDETGKLHVKVVFNGADFDPLGEGDALSIALVHNAASGLTFLREGKTGIIEGVIIHKTI